LQTKRIKNIKR